VRTTSGGCVAAAALAGMLGAATAEAQVSLVDRVGVPGLRVTSAILGQPTDLGGRSESARPAPSPWRLAQRVGDPQAPAAAPRVNPWFVRVGYRPGYVLPIGDFTTGANASRQPVRWSQSMTVEVGWQADGTRAWHHAYGLPSYGIGFSGGRFDDGGELGRPLAVYGFFSWPFAQPRERLQLTADVGVGLAWNWRPFDPQANPYNTAIGSATTYQLDLGLYLRYLANPRVSLYAGVDATHWSNGGARQPNGGLNAVGPKVGLRLNASPQPLRSPSGTLPPFTPAWALVVGLAGGGKGVTGTTTSALPGPERLGRFGAASATVDMQRHFYRYGRLAAGADVTYDGSTGSRVDLVDGERVATRVGMSQRFAMGLYGGYEHVIHRLGVIAQAGYQVWRAYGHPGRPRFYQRYGLRYYLSERLWTTMAVRVDRRGRSDFIEFGGGYRLRWE